MLRGFIAGGRASGAGREGWLILSISRNTSACRSRAELLGYFEQGGLTVIDRLEVRPSHPRVSDATDPLHAARAAEVTSCGGWGGKGKRLESPVTAGVPRSLLGVRKANPSIHAPFRPQTPETPRQCSCLPIANAGIHSQIVFSEKTICPHGFVTP